MMLIVGPPSALVQHTSHWESMIMKDAGNGRFKAAHLSELRIPGTRRGPSKVTSKYQFYEITIYYQQRIVTVRLPAIPPVKGCGSTAFFNPVTVRSAET